MRSPSPGSPRRSPSCRDAHGIPQIYASTATDLFRAQGYVHAQDRFWEMDFRRHVTAGRLAELFGPSQVATDAFLRTLGWRRVAEQELPLLAPETREYLEAYAAGVNEWIAATGGAGGVRGEEPGVHGAGAAELRRTRCSRGPRSTRWPGSRRWPGTCAATWSPRSRRGVLFAHGLTRAEVGQLYPAYPYGRNQPIVDPRCASTAHSRRTGTGPLAGNADVPWNDVAPALQALSDGGRGPAAAARRRRPGHRLQLVGDRRRAHQHRQAAAGQRPAPEPVDAGHLVPDGPAL